MEGLGISLPTLIAQVVNFVILLLLLYLVAYKPVLRMLDARSGKVKESMEQTEQIKEQAELAEKEAEKRIQEASKEGQSMLQKAEQFGEEIRQKARQDAEVQAEKLIFRAKAEIQSERDEAVSELRQQFANLTILTAGKVIDKTLDKEAHRELIRKALEESSDLN
ncbi:F0F1 ATP synthase subunit B [Chloroflexota bacterium]